MTATQGIQAGEPNSVNVDGDYGNLNQLVSDVQDGLKQNKNTLMEVEKLTKTVRSQNSEIARQNKDLRDQRDAVRATQAIVVLGFILALVALITVVLTDWMFQKDSMKQMTDQTVLLQDLKKQ